MKISRKSVVVFTLLAVFAATYIALGCPIRFLSGVSCPGCGMTRAIWSLLKLDFAGAFHYHPLVFVLPVFLAFLIKFRKDSKKMYIALFVFCFLLAVVYAFRLAVGSSNEVVYINPENGFIYKIIRRILLWQKQK